MITTSSQLQFQQSLALISEGITGWDHSEKQIWGEASTVTRKKKSSQTNN